MYAKRFAWIAFVLFAILLSACSLGLGSSSTPTAVPTALGESAPQQPASNLPVVTYAPPAQSFALIDNELMIGVSYNLTEEKEYDIVTPANSSSTIAAGHMTIDGQQFTEDKKGTMINIVLVVCRQQPEPCHNKVSGFVGGNANVTTLFAGYEDPNKTAFDAVIRGFDPKNCGDHGCNTVKYTEWGKPTVTFTRESKPSQADMKVEPVKAAVQVAVMGAPDGKVIMLGQQIVGHMFNLSGKDQWIGVTEGLGTIVSCPSGCTLHNVSVPAGQTAVLLGNDGDKNTPSDLNWTAAAEGDNMTVTMVTAGSVKSFAPDSFIGIYSTGQSKQMTKNDLP